MLEKLKGAIKNGQSRDTATLGIRHRTRQTKRKMQHRILRIDQQYRVSHRTHE